MTYIQAADTSLGVLAGDRVFQKLAHGLVWLTFAASGFVLFEPSPYDALMLGTILMFFLVGLPIPRRTWPLFLLLAAYIAGGLFAAIVPAIFGPTGKNVIITGYLIASAIFVASYVAQNPLAHFERIMNGWSVAAFYAAFSGILGYFNLAGPLSDTFLVYDRAKGTFEDPNVLGPFLIAPLLYAIYKLLRGRVQSYVWVLPQILILSLALLLAFSRGAWAHAILSGIIFGYLLIITARNFQERMQIILFGMFGMIMIIVLGIWAVSFDKVGNLFENRAAVTQAYDSGPAGRFARQQKALDIVLENPAGIGAEEFVKTFPEAPHNVYLNVYIIAGWLGGTVYLILVLSTLAIGFRQALIHVPWQNVYILIYATYVGVALEGLIIDTDHWRHYFVLMGLVWAGAVSAGGILTKRKHTRPTASITI
jgi:O-antigen ligase/polysaccharide polymerase Wzy-like membrane protein